MKNHKENIATNSPAKTKVTKQVVCSVKKTYNSLEEFKQVMNEGYIDKGVSHTWE